MNIVESNFKNKLTNNEFVITMEVSPPDEFDLQSFFPKFDFLSKTTIDALNITDTARAQGRMSPLAISSLIQNQFDIETIMHIAVRHRNLLSLHSDLMGAHALGIKNIFSVMGDKPKKDSPFFNSTFSNLTPNSALKLMDNFNKGISISGEKLKSSANFYKGAAFNPSTQNLEKEIQNLKLKVESGADFLLTQPFYSTKTLQNILNIIGEFPIPLIIGVLPLRSIKNAQFLQNHVPGININSEIMSLMESSKSPIKTGMEISSNIVNQLKGKIAGMYYIPPFNNYKSILEFTKRLELPFSFQ